VSSRFVWLGLANDITAWARSCLHCQQSKIRQKVALLLAAVFTLFKILAMAYASTIIFTKQKPTSAFSLRLVRKLKCRQAFTILAAVPAHATATAMHFPADAGLSFFSLMPTTHDQT
jgi:hypothetical protein